MNVVKIKEDRECCYCGGTLLKGTVCYSYSRKYKGRKWVCTTCVNLKKRISQVKSEESLIPFDDEGGAMAHADYLSEIEGKFESREGSMKGKVVR